VAYVRGFPAELWVTGAGAFGEHRLYIAPAGSPLIEDLALAPGGGVAVFDLTCPGCPASQDPGALWRLDIPAGTVRQLADHGAHWPLFSPDGNWLSIASPAGTLASHGSLGLIDLEARGTLALFEYVLVRDRAWAADSSGFVVALDRMGPNPVPTELWWVPTESEPTQLGQLVEVADLSWQPGGGRLVYQKWGHDGPTGLVVANRDGGHELSIPGSEGMAPRAYGQLPSWSPDGRWLLTMHEDGRYFLLDLDKRRLDPLEAQVVHGWLDAEQYLSSLIDAEDLAQYQRGEEMLLDLYRCEPLGPCEWLAQIPRQARLSYAPHCP
jgi:dipeptidyl aminopeptidase/acylaminoacyl peptidase